MLQGFVCLFFLDFLIILLYVYAILALIWFIYCNTNKKIVCFGSIKKSQRSDLGIVDEILLDN